VIEQQTVGGSFTLQGIGIHTGAQGRVTVRPAEAGTGRVFRLGGVAVPARADYVVDSARCTVLGAGGARVATVEHLLAALHGCGIDNALMEVSGPELPVLDGSAAPFVAAIRDAGIVGQSVPARILTLGGRVARRRGEGSLEAESSEAFAASVTTGFGFWPEGAATITFSGGPCSIGRFQADIAGARTFAFAHEVQALLDAGLARGGSLDNALVITPPDGYSSPLRMAEEWCVHKLLDLMGDLALVDARLQMRVRADRPGHAINTEFARELLGLRLAQETGRTEWT
jgi:UDP-3-O-[3-hydroxymyristoyl] N-acetylglucosamine deacetylase